MKKAERHASWNRETKSAKSHLKEWLETLKLDGLEDNLWETICWNQRKLNLSQVTRQKVINVLASVNCYFLRAELNGYHHHQNKSLRWTLKTWPFIVFSMLVHFPFRTFMYVTWYSTCTESEIPTYVVVVRISENYIDIFLKVDWTSTM